MSDAILWTGTLDGGGNNSLEFGPIGTNGLVYYVAINNDTIYKCICETGVYETTVSGAQLEYVKFISEEVTVLEFFNEWNGNDFNSWRYAFIGDDIPRSATLYDCKMEAAPLDNKFLSDTIARITDIEALEAKHDEDIVKAN
jgi:hypothetical protein